MNDSVQKSGTFEVIDLESRSSKLSAFVRAVSALLLDGFPSTGVVVLVDSIPSDEISERILDACGKRRCQFLTVSTTFDYVQSLLPRSARVSEAVRRRVASECYSLFEEHSAPLSSLRTPDHLVLDQPQHPFAQAYLAGLQQLGFVHPYPDLARLRLPAGVQHIFHYDFNFSPDRLRSWFLAAMPSGVTVWSTSPPKRSRGNREEPLIRSFDSEGWRRDALLDAATSGEYRFIVFERVDDLRRFHLSCLCFANLNPMVTAPSILYSPTIRLFYGFLDWLLAESVGSLETIFAMLGGRKSRWQKTARASGLPSDLNCAVRCSFSGVIDPDDPSVLLLQSLGRLRFDFATANHIDQITVLEHYFRDRVAAELAADLDFLVSFLRSVSLCLPELYLAFSRAAWWSPPSESLQLICLADEELLGDSDWLFVPRTGYCGETLKNLPASAMRSPVVFSLQEAQSNA